MGATTPRPGPAAEPTILSSVGGVVITWEDTAATERLALAEDLARWAGSTAEAAHDESYREVGLQHGWACCDQAYEDGARNEYAFCLDLPLDKLRARHAAGLAERDHD